MRDILITEECEQFISNCTIRTKRKFDYLLHIISEHDVIPKNFVDKLIRSEYYELRIKSDNEIRIIIFSIDHHNFIESRKVILLNGFVKKSNKDYSKAIRVADVLLDKYKNILQ